MARSNSTQQQAEARKVIDSVCGTPFYQLHESATSQVILDHLQARLAQLEAMLTTTCGAGHESFDGWSDEIKNNYLWACSMLADECKELSYHINVMHEQPAGENSHD